jgi:cell fate (sporulation/competence/biofilm development) regulator YmcA (YheA/YmcA/DUF963 family)
MQVYLSPIGGETDDLRRIVVKDQVGVYRDERDVYASVEGRTVDLGISDPTVSRMKNGAAPVQFELTDSGVVVRNAGNTNGVTVITGISETSVAPGTEETLSQDGTIKLGFNTELQLSIEEEEARSDTLSLSELQRRLGIEENRGVISGVDPAAHVQSVATNLRREASREATNECLKFANELADFVEQRPVDDDAYEDVQATLETITDGLERKVTTDSLKGSGLDEEWQGRIERVTHRVENMYARADS